MKRTRETILAEAMALPEGERAALAADLIDSLDSEFEAGHQAAWEAEVAERVAELDAGGATIPWEEVRRRLRGMIRG